MRKISIFSLISLILLVIFAPSVSALAAAKVQSGITIAPSIEQINLQASQSTVSFNATISNQTTSSLQFNLSAKDFTSLNNEGAISFIGANSSTLVAAHGLAQWLKFPFPSLILGPGQAKTFPVSIINTNNLSPGGHYGALIYSVSQPPSSGGDTKLSFKKVLASLIFVVTAGGGTKSLSLQNTILSSLQTRLPTNLTMIFANNGNTQLTPRGIVQIFNGKGKEVTRGIINTSSGLILPGGSRLFNVPLRTSPTQLGLGKYKLTVSYLYDGTMTTQTYHKNFLLVSWSVIIGVIVLIFIALVLLVWKGRKKLVYSLRKK